ncbi:putative dihydrofolate synthetase [Escovopsis weberi]|uniref:Putative dihydrofolate synthetase n=1 Tax=Escovopsis weberi TaxID=150374 RepID=A0A0M9VXA6_ESCWE|nr:putative dihydrofolate synthetase [Escovopsis weberi]
MPSSKDIGRALARIRAAMPAAKKVDAGHRNIKLGLDRISRVVPNEQSWVGIHVGGTNGKGSICAMLSGLLRHAGLSHGMYTSPAIPERHCGVTINGLYVNPRAHEEELKQVEAKFRRVASGWRFSAGEDPGDLTPFELETAAAFRIFSKMRVQYGIVEVGMGGATDATNIMRQKSVTVISKIDLDHQEYLGNTIEEIAQVKAGIMRPGVPCIVDHTNSGAVLKVLREHANKIGTQISPSWKGLPLLDNLDTERFKLEEYQKQNLLCAILAFRHLFPNLEIDVNRLLDSHPYLPGRKENVGVFKLTRGSRRSPVLVDGAHNMLGVQALATFVENQVRKGDEPVSWVMGLSSSKSKPFAKLIETLVRPQDNFAFVEYEPGLNEPPPVPAEIGYEVAKGIVKKERQLYDGEPTVDRAVQWACEKAGEGPVIVTGSLYLIRNFYNLDGIQWRQPKTRGPGLAQLWRYIQLAQERPLTVSENKEFKKARRYWYMHRISPETKRLSGEQSTVPEGIRNLQRQADFHRRQAEGYSKAIKSAQNDIHKAATEPSTDKPEDTIATLRNSVKELQKLHYEHLQVYNASMYRLRGYVPDKDKKFISHEELFGRPVRPKLDKFPSTFSIDVNAQDTQDDAPDAFDTPTADDVEDAEMPQDGQKRAKTDPEEDGASSRSPKKESKKKDQGKKSPSAIDNGNLAAEADDLVSKLTGKRT